MSGIIHVWEFYATQPFSLGLGFRYESVDAVRHEISTDSHLPLRFQSLDPKIRLKVKSKLERGVEIFGQGKASILVWINLVGLVTKGKKAALSRES